MAKNPFDQFSKQLLEEVLAPYGTVEISLEVTDESQLVDVFFEPSSAQAIASQELVKHHVCLNRSGTSHQRSRFAKEFVAEGDLPQLWILASSASDALLNGFNAFSNEDWGSGVYFLAPSLKAAIVAINQLPRNEETLFLRLLGKGQTQKQAVDEVIAIDTGEPKGAAILRLLSNWKISIELTGQVEAEEELMMALTQAYLEWEQQTEQRGKTEGERSLVLRLLARRVGTLPASVEAQVQALALPQLEALGEALLDFAVLGDLTDWLRNNG